MQSIWSLLDPELQKKLKKQQSLQEKMHFHLPKEYRGKVHCHLSTGYLKIYTFSSMLASKLRYQQQQILKSIDSDPELTVQKIKIMVGTNPEYLSEKTDKSTIKLSQTAKASLLQSAKMSDEPEFVAALLRLAALADKR